MTSTRDDFIKHVNNNCQSFLCERQNEVSTISADAAPLVEVLKKLTEGGKKLRPALAWIGWRSAGASPDSPGIAELGVSLELFQAAALVHDDIIDRSDTRRNQPSVHKRFEQLHTDSQFGGHHNHFGTSGAILAGDLALSWAGEAFAQAEALAERSKARSLFNTMHTEVITGQYLDVLAEVSPPAATESQAVERAKKVLRFKSARYSTSLPIMLGSALAGAPEPLQEALGAAALPIGEAFQLRDDVLGIFGDPATTGKPVGDDLREGKRTALIAYGLFRASETEALALENMLGNPHLSEDEVENARTILQDCGALGQVESEIDVLVESSRIKTQELNTLGVDAAVISDFESVKGQLVQRTS